MLDFSDYPLDSKFFDPANKKVIGKMKDEFKGKIINEFAGLKSKMYSIVSVDDKENKKANGANKNVVKSIKHREFVDVLFNKKVMRHNMKIIQSRLHRIGTYEICKISLSFFDGKRYILDDGINSLAFFLQRQKKSIKLSKIDRINEINRVSRINRINRVNRNQSTKKLTTCVFFRHYLNSIHIEGLRTKLFIFLLVVY